MPKVSEVGTETRGPGRGKSVHGRCGKNVPRHRMWRRTQVREASRSRASDSPVPGEYMDVRTARPDKQPHAPALELAPPLVCEEATHA
jgi:hypothetical protein